MCCNDGKVDLQPLPALRPPLSDLFTGSPTRDANERVGEEYSRETEKKRPARHG